MVLERALAGDEARHRDLAGGEQSERRAGVGGGVVERADERDLVVVNAVRQDREPDAAAALSLSLPLLEFV